MTSPALRVGSFRHDASPAAGPLASRVLAGILQNLAAANPSSEHNSTSFALRQWAGPCLESTGLSLRESFARLNGAQQAALRQRLGGQVEALLSLSAESDPELLGAGLLAIAAAAARREDYIAALVVYDAISQTAGPLGASLAADFRARAEREARALRGEGPFGARFEHLARGFARQAADPTMIAGMGVGSLVAGAVRLGVLSRLASARTANLFTRGLGASLTAGTAAWAAEVPAFWMTTRALHAASSETPLDWDRATLSRELASTGLMLGLLKLSGAASSAMFRRVHGIPPLGAEAARLAPFTRLSQPLFTQAGMFGGIYADHLLEERLGWRPASDGVSRAFDSAATLLQFHIGGRLAATALGPRYASALRELEYRSRMAELRNLPGLTVSGRGGLGLLGPQPAVAGEGFLPGSAVETDLSSRDSWIVAMSQVKPERVRSSRGRKVVAPVPESGVGERPVEQEEAMLLRAFRESPATGLDRLLKGAYERGRLAHLALQLEADGLRPDLSSAEHLRAREVLRNLETDFWHYLATRRESAALDRRWEVFQKWQNDLAPQGIQGFLYLQERLRSIGISDISAIKNSEIRVKTRVRANQELADYFFDLAALRDFLRERGINRVDENNPQGRYLSNLLLRGDGNCATLSLLYAHLAAMTGRTLQVGLLPRHVYLAGKEGAVIESILDFGVTARAAYQHRAIASEQKLLPAHAILSVHLLNLGKSALDRGDTAGARLILQRARDLLPHSPRADILLAQAAQRQGDIAGTLDHYRRVYALHPEDSRGLNNLRVRAWERFVAAQYREAEQAFRRINAQAPEDLDALRGLRLTYERMGLKREAEGVTNLIEIMEMDAD